MFPASWPYLAAAPKHNRATQDAAIVELRRRLEPQAGGHERPRKYSVAKAPGTRVPFE